MDCRDEKWVWLGYSWSEKIEGSRSVLRRRWMCVGHGRGKGGDRILPLGRQFGPRFLNSFNFSFFLISTWAHIDM